MILSSTLFATLVSIATPNPANAEAMITTSTVHSCPAYTSPAATPHVTYKPEAPKCKTFQIGTNVTYELYSEECYRKIKGQDGDPIDLGDTYNNLTFNDACKAAQRCAKLAGTPADDGYDGGPPDYAFQITFDGDNSWGCYSYYGQGNYPKKGYKPPSNEKYPSFVQDSFAWVRIDY